MKNYVQILVNKKNKERRRQEITLLFASTTVQQCVRLVGLWKEKWADLKYKFIGLGFGYKY